MSERAEQELDPKLEEWLAEARQAEPEVPADLDRMLADVEREMQQADSSWVFWLRSRATWMRRTIAFGAALLVVVLGGVLVLRPDIGDLGPSYLALTVGSLVVLLGLSLHAALRPIHYPAAPGWQRGAIVALTLASTGAIALLAPAHGVPAGESFMSHVSPCLFYGLLVGLPVYLLLRLLDRGSSAAALIAACAAGLTGNLVLSLHCPRHDAEHLMAAHFAVALLFVAGLGAAHWVVGRVRSR